MIKIFNPPIDIWEEILQRPTSTFQDIESSAKSVFLDVQANGDAAISKHTALFDGVNLPHFEVSNDEIQATVASVSDELKQAILLAKLNIEKFHNAQQTAKVEVETTNGVRCWQEKRAI
ncbi:MAG: histidinol dehydrogenase, partial [Flavobacterium sp.]|nr:histidinol dehydrogenase [Flavobacterium sp.]